MHAFKGADADIVFDRGQLGANGVYPGGVFGVHKKGHRVGDIGTIFNALIVKSEIERNGPGPGRHNRKIGFQPVYRIPSEDKNLVAFADALFNQGSGQTVYAIVELRPGN